MSALSEIAKRLAYLGDAQLQLADKPGVFQLPRHLGTTPQEIVANASTAKVPLSLYMPHEVAAKQEYFSDMARKIAENHVPKVAVPNYNYQLSRQGKPPLTPSEIQKLIDDAHQNIMAQWKHVNFHGNDENYVVTTPNGWAAITTPDLSNPSRTTIDALNLNSENKQGGGGTQAYQALLAIGKNQGVSNFTKELVDKNPFRKAQQLLSHGAREGTLDHIEIDPRHYFSPDLGPADDGSKLGLRITPDQFNEFDTPTKLGYLQSITQTAVNDSLKHDLRGAPLPGGLNDLMQDSVHTPYLLGSDYRDIDPDTLKSILSQTGPGSGVGSAALRQGMLTHSLNGMYDLSGGAAAPDASRFSDDFTQGLMYAEGGLVSNSSTEDDIPRDTTFRDNTVAGPVPIGVLRSLWSHAIRGGFRGPSAMDLYVAKQLGIPADRLGTKFLGSNRVVYPIDSTTVAKLATAPHGLQVQGGDSLVLKPRLTPLDSWKGLEKPQAARKSGGNNIEARSAANWGYDKDGNLQIIDEGAMPDAPAFFTPKIIGADWGTLKPVINPDYWPEGPYNNALNMGLTPGVFSRSPTKLTDDLSQAPGVVYSRKTNSVWVDSPMLDHEKPFVDQFNKEMQQRGNYAEGGSVQHEGSTHTPGPRLLDTQGVRDYLQRHLLHPVDTMIQNTNQARQDMISDPVNAGLNFVSPMAVAGGLAGVIKPQGGQWLTEGVEKGLQRLKSVPYDDFTWANLPGEIQNELASSINPYATAKQTYPKEWAAAQASADPKAAALNAWIDGPLRKYILRDMGTPEDPIRKLADEGITHLPPEADPIEVGTGGKTAIRRQGAGFPYKGVASTPEGKTWELYADRAIQNSPADLLNVGWQESPSWLQKLATEDPKHQVYSNSNSLNNLGFDHLIDHLNNQLDTDQLRPEQLSKVSVSDAVRGAHQWNQELAAQQAKANEAIMNNPATHLVKDYGDGMKWVELKKPSESTPLPDGYQVKPGLHGVWLLQHPGGSESPLGTFDNLPLNEQKAAAEAKASTNVIGYQHLQDALKYEGDAMGHCVADYCPDVAKGTSRIFSLRDKNGPHVTIEVSPPNLSDLNQVRLQNNVGEDRGLQIYRDFMAQRNDLNGINDLDEYARSQLGNDAPQRILQIKGKGQQNVKPVDKYLPYVQDFVKTQGPWSDVGDLHNTGLVDFTQGASTKLPAYEPGVGNVRKGYNIDPGYYTPTELTDHLILQGAEPMAAVKHAGAFDHPLLQGNPEPVAPDPADTAE